MNQMQASISNLANAAAVVALVSENNNGQQLGSDPGGGNSNNNNNPTNNPNNLIDIQLSEGKLTKNTKLQLKKLYA